MVVTCEGRARRLFPRMCRHSARFYSSRHAHPRPEFVIHEVSDLASAIAAETSLPVVVSCQKRALSTGDQKVALPGRVAYQGVALPHDRNDVVGPALESIFPDVFVQQAAAHLLDEIHGRSYPDEVTSHRPGQSSPHSKPGGVQALAHRPRLQSQQLRDLRLGVAEEVEEYRNVALALREFLESR